MNLSLQELAKKSLLTTAFLFSVQALATQTPSFSGEWYSFNYAATNFYTTACNENLNLSDYNLLDRTNSYQETAILWVQRKFCTPNGCPTVCKIDNAIPNRDYLPHKTFGDENLWELTISKPGNPSAMEVTVSCIAGSSGEYNRTDTVIVSPYYLTCENDGCLDVCRGDVVARDLTVFGFGSAGHTGMAVLNYNYIPTKTEPYRYSVIEALNDDSVIQVNTLNDFQESDEYWGAKYGNPKGSADGQRNISLDESLLIDNFAQDQMKYCQEYDLNPNNSHPASFTKKAVYYREKKQWIEQLGIDCGVWRCDTFVNYSYKQAGIRLPDPDRYLNMRLPSYTYNSVPHNRAFLKKATANTNLYEIPYERSTFSKAVLTTNSSDEKIDNYEIILDQSSLENMLITVDEFNKNTSFTPKQRAEIYLHSIEKNKDNELLVTMLLTGADEPEVDFTDNLESIFKLFYENKESAIKRQIIILLSHTYKNYLVTKADIKSIEKIEKIQFFYIQQLKNQQDGTLLTVLGQMPSIFPYEEIEELLDEFPVPSSPIYQKEVARLHAFIAFENLRKSKEKWDSFIQKLSDEQNHYFASAMSFYLSKPEFADSFNENQKEILKLYLLNNWPDNFGGSMHDMSDRLEALENLSTEEPSEKNEMVTCLLLQHKNAYETLSFVRQKTSFINKSKGSDCYNKLKEKIQIILSDPEFSEYSYFMNDLE